MKVLELDHMGEKVKVPAVRKGLCVWYHLEGCTYKYEMASKSRGSDSSSSDEENGVFNSPMPGKIMKIMVKLGDKVKAGSSMLVMEAMKMEYSIEAPFDGVVEALECEVNQQVALGDLLIKVGKE